MEVDLAGDVKSELCFLSTSFC